mgnify:CR=1 FL=1
MAEAKLTQIKVKEIKPSPFQVRESFDNKGIEELAKSIHTHGLLHPILVRPTKGKLPYQIVHGERRWRAVQKLGKDRILGYIRRLSDLDAEIASLVENVQREDLKPPELAKALKRLKDAGLSTKEIARRTGKVETWIHNLVGYEEEATPPLRRAVERYYEERGQPEVAPQLTVTEKSPLPAVPLRTAAEIVRSTADLERARKKVIQERFAEAISKEDLSQHEAVKALDVWKESGKRIAPEKAVQAIVKEREKEQERVADVVWVQFDKEMQEGIKIVMARENLPSVRDTVVYLVRYALEEMDVIPSRR